MGNKETAADPVNVPESVAESNTPSQSKQPLFCRFMDSALNVTIREQLRKPLQPRAFDYDKPAPHHQE